MSYQPAQNRYDSMVYRRCGKSGLKLPAVSLGLWHNFGGVDVYENARAMVLRAFDIGITHFDLANNYGPPAGSAEVTFGQILKNDLTSWRDELIISTKAGYDMWPGPYGEWGSKKYLISSLNQSLKRLGVDYVDIFYSHRPDVDTPLEETMEALAQAVRQGKALYAGLSNYNAKMTREAASILKSMGVRCLIHQPSYSMLNRWIEPDLQTALQEEGMGSIAFSPLAQGLLTNRYLNGLPEDSRAIKSGIFLKKEQITKAVVQQIQNLDDIAKARNQSLAQMAIAWVLRGGKVTSCLIGASRVSQIEDNAAVLKNLDFSEEELKKIDAVLSAWTSP